MARVRKTQVGGKQPITKERRKLFLQALRENGGNKSDAARKASPHLKDTGKGESAGWSGFRSLIDRDPRFAAEVQQVMDQVRDDIEAEIRRRGELGWDEAVIQRGQQAVMADGSPAFIRRYDTRLLLARARALMPEKYSERVIHTHRFENKRWFIDPGEIAMLPDNLVEMLATVVNALAEMRAELARVEGIPIEDADFRVIAYDEGDARLTTPEGEPGLMERLESL